METMWQKKIRLPWAGAYEVQYDHLWLRLLPDAIWLQGEAGFDRHKIRFAVCLLSLWMFIWTRKIKNTKNIRD